MKILLAEDDQPLAKLLKDRLTSEGFQVEVATDGGKAQRHADSEHFDLFVLDLNLPVADGLAVLAHVRRIRRDAPILILSGRADVNDRVIALRAGADDFLSKPFSYQELRARMDALLRRASRPAEAALRVGNLEMQLLKRSVQRNGQPVELTPKEFALLEYLMAHSGQPVTRADIARNVWKLSPDAMTNVVDVYVNYLRKKVDAGFEQKLIQTVRGIGYQIGGS